DPIPVIRHAVPEFGVIDDGSMVLVLDTIDRLLEEGRRVYVHCGKGVGRTGLVVGCWLVRHGAAEPDSVLDLLAELRARNRLGHLESPETEEQRRMVRGWRVHE